MSIEIDNRRSFAEKHWAVSRFTKEIAEVIDILDMLHNNSPLQIVEMEYKNKVSLYFAQHLLSTMNTLKSIEHCAMNLFFADAFSLTRKYRDDLFQCLFLINTISSYAEHYMNLSSVDKAFENSNFDFDSLVRFICDYGFETKKRPEDDAVIEFMKNSISEKGKDMDKLRRQFFDASKYKDILVINPIINACFDRFFSEMWKEIDRILNNYVHANGIWFITSNLPGYVVTREANPYEELLSVIRNITVMFFAFLVLIDPAIIRSSDYIDCLEMAVTPLEGSQYWVAKGFTKYIDKYVVGVSPELKKYLQENNKYGMEIL